MSTEAGEASESRPRASVAVDLGAESCRVSLLRRVGEGFAMQLVHRFPNGPVRAQDGTLRWPLQAILDGVGEGVRRCAELAPEGIASLGVDGWAVDYVRLDARGAVLEAPFCYRDERNAAAAPPLHEAVSAERMREITGVEQQPLNTVYQLYADKLSGRAQTRWLNLPEFLLHRWGGDAVAEHTNASHSQMIDLRTGVWSEEIFTGAGLDLACAPVVVRAGQRLGRMTGALAAVPGLEGAELIAPACHDTASAVAGIGESGDDWAYISCGTWSLVGTLVCGPLNSEAVRAENFTNLGAVGGLTCFHKGINGLWVLKQCVERWGEGGEPLDLASLLAEAEREPAPDQLLPLDDPTLLGMGDMPSRINALRRAGGLPMMSERREDAPRIVSLLLHSLAGRYALVLERVRAHSGKELRRVVMVGGGARNAMLRRLTAERTKLEVVLGPVESSTVGNLAVQRAVLEGAAPEDGAAFVEAVRRWARLLGPLC